MNLYDCNLCKKHFFEDEGMYKPARANVKMSKIMAKKYLKRYFKAQCIKENDTEFTALVRILNKLQRK